MLDKSSPFTTPTKNPAPQVQLKEFAFRLLYDAILSCELWPGDYVTEAEFAKRFGLSKTPIRDALTRLAAIGFVQTEQRRGWQISPLTGRSMSEVIEMRRRLEPALINKAIDEECVKDLLNLASILAATAGADATSTDETRNKCDRDFMNRLAAANGNLLMSRWLTELWDRAERIQRFVTQCTEQFPPLSDRLAVVHALEAGNMEEAKDALLKPVDEFEVFAARALLTFDVDLGGIAHDASTVEAKSAKPPARKRKDKLTRRKSASSVQRENLKLKPR